MKMMTVCSRVEVKAAARKVVALLSFAGLVAVLLRGEQHERGGGGVGVKLRQGGRRLTNARDPKSVVVKSTVAGQEEETNEYHNSNLKYLFLGTSRTFGSHLKDRKQEAYPYLLTPNPINLAIPAGNPLYPRKCLYSMVSSEEMNDAFDVVILEYSTIDPDVVHLVQRLRQRYPNAKIIVLEMWLLNGYANGEISSSLYDFAKNNVPDAIAYPPQIDQLDANQLRHKVMDLTNAMSWRRMSTFAYDETIVKQLQDLDSGILKIPAPYTIAMALIQAHYFTGDMGHFSPDGHRMLTDAIWAELARTNFRKHHDATLGMWDEQDKCDSWFLSGSTQMVHDPNLVMTEFVPTKYALEARALETYITVENHSSQPAGVAVQHMVNMPECRYPDTEISIVSSNPNHPNPSPVIATCPESIYSWSVNMAHLLHVGTIPPGKSTLKFRALEPNKEYPFRIVGVSVSSREDGRTGLGKGNLLNHSDFQYNFKSA